MDNWKQSQKRIKHLEVIAIAVAIVTLFFGGICDVLVRKGIIFIVVENIEGVSLTLLQIQGTITTLTLMIIALLSGNVSESYMGVSISQYYLEKRPFLLKQSRVILAEFVCLFISIWGHILATYNLVIAFFMVALLLIVISIFEVYTIFNGRRNRSNEIAQYVTHQLQSGKDYKDVIISFMDDWKQIAIIQSSEDFDRYFKLFMIAIERSLDEEASTENINRISEDIAVYLLSHESKMGHVRGLYLINDYYERLWYWIDKNKEKAKTVKGQIHLIDKLAHEWYLAMDSLDAETLEKNMNWNVFSESVIRVSTWIGKQSNDELDEVAAINSLGRTFGGYIAKQHKKGNIVNLSWWEHLINNRFGYGAFGIPEESADYYRESLAIRDFNVCYGYLLNGQANLVKNAVFLDEIGNTYIIEYPEQVFKAMLIHCFMYYLGFRESVNCIDEELQKEVAVILRDKQVINAINHFYYRVIEENIHLTESIEDRMESVLERYELFPKHSNGKSIILEDIVKEYFLYVALIVERYSYKRDALGEVLNVDKYQSYLFARNHQILRKHFAELRQLFEYGEHTEEDNLKKADDMMAVFDSVMKEKYKKNIINTAAESQREFEEKGVKTTTEEEIKKVIQEKFDSLFGNMSKNFKGAKKYKKIHVFRCADYTKWLGEELRKAYSDYPFGNFSNWLMHVLEISFGVKVVERDSKFASDKEFREFLKEKGYKVLIGSQYVFGCENYEEYREHSDFLSENICIFTPTSHEGIACSEDALCIKLDDISVNIYSPNLDDVDVKINEKTGLISYSPTADLSIDFEEYELKEYLHNERKVVDIFFSITLGVKKDLCVILTRNNRDIFE